jgi:hypothetical protein
MRPFHLPRLTVPDHGFRLLALWFAGWVLMALLASFAAGALYMWFGGGPSPIDQVRELGFGALVVWPVLAAFGMVEVAAAFVMERPWGPWAIAGITLCLFALWALALRRGRAHEHTVLNH